MDSQPPKVVLLAGPNGAGKSTSAAKLLLGTLQVSEFVNADAIAKGLSGFAPEEVAIEAGRVMLDRLDELAAQRASFAFETTLASRSFVPRIQRLQADGYEFHLLFLWLPNAEMAVARVADRVRAGGHNVPETTIRRRYAAGLRNLRRLYLPLVSRGASKPATDGRFKTSQGLVGVVTVIDSILRTCKDRLHAFFSFYHTRSRWALWLVLN